MKPLPLHPIAWQTARFLTKALWLRSGSVHAVEALGVSAKRLPLTTIVAMATRFLTKALWRGLGRSSTCVSYRGFVETAAALVFSFVECAISDESALVDLPEDSLNQLFETLADWTVQLEAIEPPDGPEP